METSTPKQKAPTTRDFVTPRLKHQKSEINQDNNKGGTDTADSIFSSGSGSVANNTFDCSLILPTDTVISSPSKVISANIYLPYHLLIHAWVHGII